MRGEGPNLLGQDLLETIQVRFNGVCNPMGTFDQGVDETLTKHINIFANELGALEVYKAKLNVDLTAMTRFCKANSHTGQHQLHL